jgi:uncharacterized protein YfbU (UPF0304 family)
MCHVKAIDHIVRGAMVRLHEIISQVCFRSGNCQIVLSLCHNYDFPKVSFYMFSNKLAAQHHSLTANGNKQAAEQTLFIFNRNTFCQIRVLAVH